MAHVSEEVRVDRPVSEVYNQWTQFEEFPKFMERHRAGPANRRYALHWKAKIGGQTPSGTPRSPSRCPTRCRVACNPGCSERGSRRFSVGGWCYSHPA